jgi:hypothetical protein
MSKQRPSIERLRAVLAYDPETGKLTWRVRTSNRIKVGDDAGSVNADGYLQVQIDGVYLRAHRAIFAMVKGRWPKVDVDHEDRDRTNNRWLNLREANNSQNSANRCVTNSTGFKGVRRAKWGFEARISHQGRRIYIGAYRTPDEANAAYAAKATELFGKFARAA